MEKLAARCAGHASADRVLQQPRASGASRRGTRRAKAHRSGDARTRANPLRARRRGSPAPIAETAARPSRGRKTCRGRRGVPAIAACDAYCVPRGFPRSQSSRRTVLLKCRDLIIVLNIHRERVQDLHCSVNSDDPPRCPPSNLHRGLPDPAPGNSSSLSKCRALAGRFLPRLLPSWRRKAACRDLHGLRFRCEAADPPATRSVGAPASTPRPCPPRSRRTWQCPASRQVATGLRLA